MKKMILSLVVAILCATAMFAQSTLVATLSHGENVSMFYGTYALRDAYNAAVSGDIINLSGGGFQAVDFKKGVTLRGTGIDEAVPTTILSGFNINIPSEDANRFSMEGIRCDGIYMQGSYQNPYFLKCRINHVSINDSYAVIKNAMFVNCKITNDVYLRGMSTVQFINCYVNGFLNNNETTSSASFINCVILPYGGYQASYLRSCQLMNCILYNNSTNWSQALPSTTIASNCIAINDNDRMSNLFNNSQANPNCGHALYSEMFKDFTGTYSDEQTFELSEAGKTRLLGADGTEIGMHGGLMPYTSIPSYPRITKMNVASKTTADGKLSVEIEVSAAE